MKLSDVKREFENLAAVKDLCEMRDAASDSLQAGESAGTVKVVLDDDDGYETEVEITGAGVAHVLAALRQQIVDIEFELTALGIEIDVAPGSDAASGGRLDEGESPDASESEAA